MSFRNLLEGDCGGQNPLMKLGSHFTQDQAYRQDRAQEYSQADLLVHEFLEDSLSQNVQTFRMDELFREMRDIESSATKSAINQAPNVAQLASEEPHSLWSEQFLAPGKQMHDQGQSLYMSEGAQDLTLVQGSLGDLGGTWGGELEKMTVLDDSQFGLGKDWVENFLKKGTEVEDSKPAQPANIEEETVGSSKFIKFMQKTEDGGKEWSDEFLSLEDKSKALTETEINEIWDRSEAGAVAAEVATSTDPSMDDVDYSNQFWKKLQSEWEKISKEEGPLSWEKEFGEYIDPFKEYTFETENPMKETEAPFEEGLRKLQENDLPSAVLCFEAAAQAQPDEPLVWQYLGTTQAQNEQDPHAIAALKKCISLQSDNLVALMSLAISYTNENYQNQACQVLKEWLRNNPKYTDLVRVDDTSAFHVSSLLSSNIHQDVRDLFIQAANKFPSGEIDVDIQCGLGVLFNLSNEYDKAVDCFKAALQTRPNDFRTWNRLGATLANGNRSEEAVDAYYNALQLSPGFIRARYNLGITCVNLGANREAAEHLLIALNQQAKGRTSQGAVGVMSDSIWSTLRLVVNLLGKPELLPYLETRDLGALSKEFKVK